METDFTPFASLLGGALIGLSAIVLLAAHGRIAGISGIVSRILPPSIDKAGLPQGVIFLTGLCTASTTLSGSDNHFGRFSWPL